ncbi:MAG: Ku protein [Flavobacteriaceae bacterium]
MAPRAIWKGHLQISELSCPVALYAAASSAERISLHMVNRKTGHRLHRQFVDEETGEPVDKDDQVKGFETDKEDFILLEPEEIEAAVPESDKTLDVEAFIACGDVETVYFDRPYYVAPATEAAETAFAVVREGMRKTNVAAIARAVLFRRVRTVLIRAQGRGLVATTLNHDYEVRSASDIFDDVPEIRIGKEMMDLAKHIIGTKAGEFDPATFDDRYDAALAELVKAKAAGKKLPVARAKREEKVVDLMDALRRSAQAEGKRAGKKKSAGKAASSRRKAS